ncbi:hypothetical protein GGX14DRAFT_580524 [Mycena pura]|uniref:Uncharacterized protein n=1 Tax=Mycena pura TaxID=153505 RepID=A0AAD6UKV1_9AGAR|nr:hypothetical protein GGX14DRAFT_580524 [Mycena pura]
MSSSPPTSSSSEPAADAGLQSAINSIFDATDALGQRGGKRARRGPMGSKSAAEKMITLARYHSRAVGLFDDIGIVLETAANQKWGQAAPSAPARTRGPALTEKERRAEAKRQKHLDGLRKCYDLMIAQAPEMEEVIRNIYKSPKWDAFLALMRTAATGAQHSDTNKLKSKVHYALLDAEVLFPKLLEDGSKSDRGVKHNMLRKFLAPWPLREKISETVEDESGQVVPSPEAQELIDGLCNLTHKLDHNEWPSIFYEHGKYDDEDKSQGLFRSLFLLRIMRHVWTAPRSAMGGTDTLPATCNARASGQFKSTGRMVAHACTHGRTMLSTKDWSRKDGAYDYVKMYRQVVALFEDDPEDEWVVETLEWYNDRVFNQDILDIADDEDSDDEMPASATAQILKQRRARKAAAATNSNDDEEVNDFVIVLLMHRSFSLQD